VFLCAVQIDKLFTIGVIQPDIVADDKVDLVLEKVNVLNSLHVGAKTGPFVTASQKNNATILLSITLSNAGE